MKYTVMKNHITFWKAQYMGEKEKSNRKYWLYAFTMVNLSFLFFGVVIEKDFLIQIEVMAPALSLLGVACCYIAYFVNFRLVYLIISTLQRHYDEHKLNPKDRSIILSCYGEADRMFKIFSVMIVCTAVGFVAAPMIIYSYQYIKDKDGTLILPFKAAYPWELKGTYFVISYILQIILLVFVMSMVIMNVATPVSFAMAIVSLLKLTQERFKEIETGEDGLVSLRLAIKSHQEALDLMSKVDKVENGKFFVQVSLTALVLSMCCFRITKAESMETFVTFTGLICSVIAHIFLLCYYGQKIIDEELKLSEDIYSVAWYNQSHEFKSSICFCIMRAAKIEKLNALRFYDLSFESFNAVMTSAFSYLTFLQTVAE